MTKKIIKTHDLFIKDDAKPKNLKKRSSLTKTAFFEKSENKLSWSENIQNRKRNSKN